jgi:integrase
MTERLSTTAMDLHEIGYTIRDIGKIKQRHVEGLVKYWQSKNLAAGTIKNRMSDLRFVCKATRRLDVIKPRNSDYGIGKRRYVPVESKAIHEIDLSKVKDPFLKHSLKLQQAFGLRREECLKIIPSQADKGTHLWLKGSWTKGNIERVVIMTTPEQRKILDDAKAFAKRGKSLIPKQRNYIQQRHLYDREIKALGYKNLHGLRHAYAQHRYKAITGNEAPINGGLKGRQLSKAEKMNDRTARLQISRELGHTRVSITKVYVG